MILGAGIYQVPLIRTARRMGLYTIVVSIPGDYPGFALADKIYELNTRDKEAILAAAEKEQIDGICTSGTDVAVSTIGYVCEKMHLSGIPYEAAEILTDKAKMKDAFRQGGVSAADGMRVRSAEEAQKAAEQLGYPVVVKRVDSSGSRGITVVEHSRQIEEAYENARNGSARDYVLVEKFLRGTEIGVDGFVQNHKLVFLAPHMKFVYRGAHTTVPVGHAFPYGCSGALREEIARQMQLAVTASGADQCSVNADVFVDGEKVWIIEMGGRTGATCIPELISTYYGFDFYEQMIKSALGEETDFQQTESCPCMAKLLLSPVSGTITQIDRDQVERLRQEGLELVLDYPEGHEVSAMADGTDRIGHVIVKTDREAELDEQMKRVYRCIWMRKQQNKKPGIFSRPQKRSERIPGFALPGISISGGPILITLFLQASSSSDSRLESAVQLHRTRQTVCVRSAYSESRCGRRREGRAGSRTALRSSGMHRSNGKNP